MWQETADAGKLLKRKDKEKTACLLSGRYPAAPKEKGGQRPLLFLPLPPATLYCLGSPATPTLQWSQAPSPQGPPPWPPPGAQGGPAGRAMKLQAVMEMLPLR